LVRQQWAAQLQDDNAWNAALQVGVIANTGEANAPELNQSSVTASPPPHPPSASHSATSSQSGVVKTGIAHTQTGTASSLDEPNTADSSPSPLRGEVAQGRRVARGEGAIKDGEALELLFRPDPTI